MSIIPMTDLRDTERLEQLCAEEGQVYVTKNGAERLVVMDIDYYEQTIRKMYEAKMIAEGLDDVKNGRLHDGREVINRLRSKYNI